jgi:putative phosphoribosyl transferase
MKLIRNCFLSLSRTTKGCSVWQHSKEENMKRLNESTVSIPVGKHIIQGDLSIPVEAKGAVIFAHGSGSSRQSPRNKYVAEILNQSQLATLLIDLLTLDEERVDTRTGEHRFNIELLAERLVAATDWTGAHQKLSNLRRGYFGASTGAAAALVAAAQRPDVIDAIVSRGGRPDLAGGALGGVIAPTLFIVGEFDRDVIELNQQAAEAMRAPTKLQIVPGATHLFEEPGALENVASLARTWFDEELIRKQAA